MGLWDHESHREALCRTLMSPHSFMVNTATTTTATTTKTRQRTHTPLPGEMGLMTGGRLIAWCTWYPVHVCGCWSTEALSFLRHMESSARCLDRVDLRHRCTRVQTAIRSDVDGGFQHFQQVGCADSALLRRGSWARLGLAFGARGQREDGHTTCGGKGRGAGKLRAVVRTAEG